MPNRQLKIVHLSGIKIISDVGYIIVFQYIWYEEESDLQK